MSYHDLHPKGGMHRPLLRQDLGQGLPGGFLDDTLRAEPSLAFVCVLVLRATYACGIYERMHKRGRGFPSMTVRFPVTIVRSTFWSQGGPINDIPPS